MKPYEHEGQIHVPKRKPALKTRATMVAVGAACIALVTLGWIEGVRSTVQQGALGASETFTGAGSAFTELKSRTSASPNADAQAAPLDASVSPYLDAAEERMQALDLVSDIVKEQMEADADPAAPAPTTKAPEKGMAPPAAKATPPDASPEPTE